MDAACGLTFLLWLAAAADGLYLPEQGQKSKRTDDENPLVAVVDQLSRDLLTVKAQLAAQQNEIAALRAGAVAFSAYISDEPHVQAAHGSAAPFKGLMANVGGGYSGVTSAFTAPVAGHYFFTVHADCSADFRSLQVNGRRVFAADNDSRDGHVTGSGLVLLRKGDVVTTQYLTDAGVLDAGNESTFTGFLVK